MELTNNNYSFYSYFIKPNNADVNSSYYFEENIYKILKYDISKGPIKDINSITNILTDYLSNKKDILERKKLNFNTMLTEIENIMNPRGLSGRSFEVKTCLNSENELIMFIFDSSITDANQINHMATIFGPTFEAIMGPVFIIKMIKKKGNPVKNVDIDFKDLVKIWIANKQVKYLDFFDGNWTQKYMFNNNTSIDANKYKFENIGSHIVFYKLKNECFDVKDYLVTNFNNTTKLIETFEHILVCKLKLGEYINEELGYNKDMATIKDYIATTAMNGFEDYNKMQVIMENIFQDIDDNVKL